MWRAGSKGLTLFLMKSFKVNGHLFELTEFFSRDDSKTDRKEFKCDVCGSRLTFTIFKKGAKALSGAGGVWVFYKMPGETVGMNARHRSMLSCSAARMEDAAS